MADENTNPPPTDPVTPPAEGASTPPTASQSTERTFSQADVDRIVKERLARESQRRTEPARPAQQPTKQADPPANTPAPADALALLQLRDDFDDAISDIQLDGGQKKFLRGLVMDKRPQDVAGFIRGTVEQLGLGKRTTTAPAPAATAVSPPPAPSGPPVTSGGPPPPSNPVRTDTPIHKLSIPDREALVREIGPIEFKNRLSRESASVLVKGDRRGGSNG
jgi:hypothetical protein